MMTTDDAEELQEIVGRHLDSSELATFESLETISPSVLEIVKVLSRRYRILACKYLHERVPTADIDEVMLSVAALTESSR